GRLAQALAPDAPPCILVASPSAFRSCVRPYAHWAASLVPRTRLICTRVWLLRLGVLLPSMHRTFLVRSIPLYPRGRCRCTAVGGLIWPGARRTVKAA